MWKLIKYTYDGVGGFGVGGLGVGGLGVGGLGVGGLGLELGLLHALS